MLEFFLAILLMIASAWLLGEAFQRLGQPALVGQLLAGIVIGPSVINLVQPTSNLVTVENVALFFIMLLTGLAVKPSRLIAAGRRGAIVSSISFIIPFAAGFLVARFFGMALVPSLTIGLTVSITAVPVNAIILMELGLIDTELGATVIAAGVIDDIISFVALSMIQQFSGGASAIGEGDIAAAVLKVALFLGVLFLSERLIRRNIGRVSEAMGRLASRMRTPGSYIAFVIIFSLGVSLLAEWAGMQLVIGTFFAGFILSELGATERLEKATEVVRGTTFGFFALFAFSFIGTEVVLSSISGMLTLVAVLLGVAVVSKLAGGYAGARIGRFSSEEGLIIGFLMNSRGFIELVIASTAYQMGLINQAVFSLVVSIGMITTIISPIASRVAIRRMKNRPKTSMTR